MPPACFTSSPPRLFKRSLRIARITYFSHHSQYLRMPLLAQGGKCCRPPSAESRDLSSRSRQVRLPLDASSHVFGTGVIATLHRRPRLSPPRHPARYQARLSKCSASPWMAQVASSGKVTNLRSSSALKRLVRHVSSFVPPRTRRPRRYEGTSKRKQSDSSVHRRSGAQKQKPGKPRAPEPASPVNLRDSPNL